LEHWSYSQLADIALLKLVDRAALLLEHGMPEPAAYLLMYTGIADGTGRVRIEEPFGYSTEEAPWITFASQVAHFIIV
jgi:hypothetical protein